MSLLHEPEPHTTGAGRWILIVVLISVAAGATYMFMLRQPGNESVDEGPARVAATPAPAFDPPAPEPEPEPAPERNPEPVPEVREPEPTPPVSAVETSAPVVLRVTSDVDGADVFVDRNFVGKTPFESSEVSPGSHRLNVSAPGYDGFSENIEIADSMTVVDVTFKTVRLDQQVVVVHKHRFGNCTGQLVATLDGLQYQTHDDDAFTVRLDALEEFSIDYLEHNLRLKVAGGRTYNFTDDEPNADKLFVFHRAVEEAQEQLAAAPGQ